MFSFEELNHCPHLAEANVICYNGYNVPMKTSWLFFFYNLHLFIIVIKVRDRGKVDKERLCIRTKLIVWYVEELHQYSSDRNLSISHWLLKLILSWGGRYSRYDVFIIIWKRCQWWNNNHAQSLFAQWFRWILQ